MLWTRRTLPALRCAPFRTCLAVFEVLQLKGGNGKDNHARLRMERSPPLGLYMQGTALYALQSCMNHADSPNALAIKGDDEVDGRAVLTAARNIAAGEEVCISYVAEDASEIERKAVLRDYGVPC